MKLEGAGLGIGLGIMAFLVINVAAGREIVPGPRRAFEPIEPVVVETDPARLYSMNCAACHQAEGTGLPGQFPPLAGSPWVTQDPETPIRVLLRGLQGSIDVEGQTYDGVMPAQGHLTDQQVAAVVTHIRTSFGNTASPVDEATVAAVRTELQGQVGPWNGGAELAGARNR